MMLRSYASNGIDNSSPELIRSTVDFARYTAPQNALNVRISEGVGCELSTPTHTPKAEV